MNNNRNLTFPLANMVAGSSNEPAANSADHDRGFEIYFQRAADRQLDVVNNSSSSVQMNQSLVYSTPDFRNDQGSQITIKHTKFAQPTFFLKIFRY